jgi:hypothetical protein
MGVAQDVGGHVFAAALPFFPGGSKKDKCANLWKYLQKWYKDEQVPASLRLQTLAPADFLKDKAPNKLRGKAAHAAALVPFLPVLCRHVLPASDKSQAEVTTADALAECYKLLPRAPCPEMAAASRKFANSYCAVQALVEQETPGSLHWHVKPKLHLFQELCEFSSRNPRDFWCYRDETFGSVVAALEKRRGGRDSPGYNTKVVLQSWCCLTPFFNPATPASSSA